MQNEYETISALCDKAREKSEQYAKSGDDIRAFHWRTTCERLNSAALWWRDSAKGESV